MAFSLAFLASIGHIRAEVVYLFKRGLVFLSFGHFVNDFLNGVLGAILPLLVVHFHLSYMEAGALMMLANVSSSLIQPVFGLVSDRVGSPWLLPFGAIALGLGLAWLSIAGSFVSLLPAVCLSGIGSAAFHPDASRAVFFAAGSRRGTAQSIFQIGGNLGMALSPLALWFLGTAGLHATLWFMIPAICSTVVLSSLVRWFGAKLTVYRQERKQTQRVAEGESHRLGLTLLVAIVTVRAWAVSGVTVFVPLLATHLFHVPTKDVWIYSFVFLIFGALGTIVGGPLADRMGQRRLIQISMGVTAPFAVMLAYLPRVLWIPDLAVIGFFSMCTFAVTVVYGQEMLPHNIAMVSGLIIGFAGGLAGLGTMVMGSVADHIGLVPTLKITMWVVPVAVLCSLWLPADRHTRMKRAPLGTVPSSVTR